MHSHLLTTLDDIHRVPGLGPDERIAAIQRTDQILAASDPAIAQLLAELSKLEPPQHPAATELLVALWKRLQQRAGGRRPVKREASAESNGLVAPLTELGRRWSFDRRHYHHWLAILAAGPASGMATFTEWIVTLPPDGANDAAVAFSPMFQRRDGTPALLFPDLLEGLKHRSVAGLILDLANYLVRQEYVSQHPAAGRVVALVALLGELVQRLAQVEERAAAGSAPSDEERQAVDESLSLAVSLCDALALIGDRVAVGKLHQALERKHRRLRTEAAGALARLGEPAGIEALVTLAAEPIARLRVLAYAEELGLLARIPDRYQTPESRAEAELVLWLSQPGQMGIPPSEAELFDSRTQYWPSYDEPVECYLFRFSYHWGGRSYSNIGISGPLTLALGADLLDLSPADIYAVFAGWQAEHADIYSVDASELNPSDSAEAARLQRRLLQEGYESIEPLQLGFFFGERILIARAQRGAQSGHALVDRGDVFWYPDTSGRSLEAGDLYNLYKGRQLLQAFNPT